MHVTSKDNMVIYQLANTQEKAVSTMEDSAEYHISI